MPNELQLRTPDGNVVTHIPSISRLIKGIAGPALDIVVVSLSTDTVFRGAIYVEPVFGRNFSDDLEISVVNGPWTNLINVEIWPGIAYPFRFRINPQNTPPQNTGRAGLAIVGDFSPVVPVVS